MPTTTNLALRYPASSAAPNVPLDIGNLASDVDAALAPIVDGEWATYTPTWTAATVNPVIGVNGLISGRYQQRGLVVHCLIRIAMGNTTTFGTGSYSVSLPVPAYWPATTQEQQPYVGSGMAFDNSVSTNRFVLGVFLTGASTAALFVGDGSGNVSPTAPFTWATSDYMAFNLTYEAAP